MSLVNICRSNNDPFYRYKMPLIQAKTEGSGNGIKTNILNLSDVATALARPASYVMKYFGFELGAQTTIDEKNEKFLINGVHGVKELQDCLDGFIDKFVLCLQCKNPETVLEIVGKDNLQRDCKACGKITRVNPTYKLVSYILKNPPKKESKKSSKKANTASANVIGGGKSISDIANRQQRKNTDDDVSVGEAGSKEKVIVKDEDWSVDMSEDAIKARARELEKLNIGESRIKYQEFGNWLLSSDELPSDIEIYKKIISDKINNDRQTVEVLAQVLFDDDIADEIVNHKGLLAKLLTSEKMEKSLLGGIERMIGVKHPELIPKVPKILMLLYDNDLVSEDVIRDWGSHVSKKYVDKETSRNIRKAARPFLKWLDEAEEDSEEEESDDE
ncbi:Eukaryotic translation initiation factor 5 [Pichia kudriavzevii]|uniref:Eukaryotic translation initiation factor 5 n=1 Tax=Pichia kudriavzevii TaxID=4909 RepID=A0A1V2LHU6_PICKU|nr:eukaryotic translation initiation factor 5 [Lacticaseibacillus paracasei]ONH70498.1 Eukaryotic translation initiation factor 5 [Pichia kudriavzevii]ONH71718.1 Eukaryotic translation initiation factor 5 [Pichia kudriavzevii]